VVSYVIRHRLRSPVLGWIWGIVLIVPPFVCLLATAIALNGTIIAISGGVQATGDSPQNYYDADTQRLRAPLKAREIRRGVAGPEGEIVIIEPGGDWRIVQGLVEHGRPPVREGKLTPGQLAMLAEHLAREKFQFHCQAEMGVLPFMNPPPNHDALYIEFGD